MTRGARALVLCPDIKALRYDLDARERLAEAEGITCSVYTHPVGFHGHAAGPTIGMWDNQGPTPVQGDWPIYPSTVYAIEGNIQQQVPEWGGQWVQMKLEQSALFDGERVLSSSSGTRLHGMCGAPSWTALVTSPCHGVGGIQHLAQRLRI